MTDQTDPTNAQSPNRGFVERLKTTCSGADSRPNRAKLRRALRHEDGELDALFIIGPSLPATATRDDVALALGVAGLYATFAPDGATGVQWRSLGHVMRPKSRTASADARAPRELQKLKSRLDTGNPKAAIKSLRLILATLDEHAASTLDWGLLLSDMRNLLRGRHHPKSQQAWHRWCVGLARGDDNTDNAEPPPPSPDTESVLDTAHKEGNPQ